MTNDGGNRAATIGKAADFGAFSAMKLCPLCNLYLEACLRTDGIPTLMPKIR
jgi:hypothetical protein